MSSARITTITQLILLRTCTGTHRWPGYCGALTTLRRRPPREELARGVEDHLLYKVRRRVLRVIIPPSTVRHTANTVIMRFVSTRRLLYYSDDFLRRLPTGFLIRDVPSTRDRDSINDFRRHFTLSIAIRVSVVPFFSFGLSNGNPVREDFALSAFAVVVRLKRATRKPTRADLVGLCSIDFGFTPETTGLLFFFNGFFDKLRPFENVDTVVVSIPRVLCGTTGKYNRRRSALRDII